MWKFIAGFVVAVVLVCLIVCWANSTDTENMSGVSFGAPISSMALTAGRLGGSTDHREKFTMDDVAKQIHGYSTTLQRRIGKAFAGERSLPGSARSNGEKFSEYNIGYGTQWAGYMRPNA